MKKALIVDDTKNIRNLLTTCLEINGYEVCTASDGKAAIEIFKSANLDIAFLDIKMPEISGTEVLRQIRSCGIGVPVVIMTAFATVKNAVECTKLGAVAYLQKPFTVEKVKNVLKEFECQGEENVSDIEQKISGCKKLITDERYSEALNTLKELLVLNPTNGETYYLLGMVYEKTGKQEQAYKFYKTAEVFGYKIK